jgi:hypothetical protein
MPEPGYSVFATTLEWDDIRSGTPRALAGVVP